MLRVACAYVVNMVVFKELFKCQLFQFFVTLPLSATDLNGVSGFHFTELFIDLQQFDVQNVWWFDVSGKLISYM